MSCYDEQFFWYWFVNIREIGSRSRKQLIERFGHPKKLYDVKVTDLESILTKEQLYYFEESRDYHTIESGLKRLEREGIRFVCWGEEDYPSRLSTLYDPPYGLYLKGRLPPDRKPSVAIVGSRRPTPYGRKMADRFASELARRGVVIISGMASGIDAQAHKAALRHRGDTLGVLGGGIDTMYPRNNWDLYLDMYQDGGILSEYNIGVVNQPGLFPMRNRIISGLSDIVLVVEAGEKSGSLITADQGMEQGREIFAIPGRVTDPMSAGCNHLIAQGACVAESSELILSCLQDRYPCLDNTHDPEDHDICCSPEEKIIMQNLDEIDAVSFEELMVKSCLEPQTLQHFLLELEMKSMVIQCRQNLYLKK